MNKKRFFLKGLLSICLWALPLKAWQSIQNTQYQQQQQGTQTGNQQWQSQQTPAAGQALTLQQYQMEITKINNEMQQASIPYWERIKNLTPPPELAQNHTAIADGVEAFKEATQLQIRMFQIMNDPASMANPNTFQTVQQIQQRYMQLQPRIQNVQYAMWIVQNGGMAQSYPQVQQPQPASPWGNTQSVDQTNQGPWNQPAQTTNNTWPQNQQTIPPAPTQQTQQTQQVQLPPLNTNQLPQVESAPPGQNTSDDPWKKWEEKWKEADTRKGEIKNKVDGLWKKVKN
jgi:hypothetical protein